MTVLVEKLVPVLEDVVSRMGDQATREGSEMNELVKTVVGGMRTLAIQNPEFMKSVAVPLIEAWRQILAEAESLG